MRAVEHLQFGPDMKIKYHTKVNCIYSNVSDDDHYDSGGDLELQLNMGHNFLDKEKFPVANMMLVL